MAADKRSAVQAKDSAKSAGFGLGSLAGLTFAAATGWILYSRYGINHHVSLVDAISADRDVFFSKTAGRINFYHDNSAPGRPLVLVHSVNAAASAYEMGPLFAYYRGKRPVYALDLPGFGFSERSSRIYSAQLYEDAILDLLATQVGEPADVVALSLGSEFAARAALAQPEWIHSLVLISPSGLSRMDRGRSMGGRWYRISNALHPLLSFRIWGRAIYDLICTHSSIEFFLQNCFVGGVPPGMVEYGYAVSHQPGAEYAPLYFLSGKLFTPQVRSMVYERIKAPSMVIYDRDFFTKFDALPETLMKNPAWQAVRLVPSRGMPHFERLADTIEVIEGFWRGIKPV